MAIPAKENKKKDNDIVFFNKLATGWLPVVGEKFDLYEVVQNVIEWQRGAALEKNLDLKIDIDSNVPQYIISDKSRIYCIILNLVDNAVKFTKEGYVKIALQIARKIDTKHFILKVVVSDTGIGIPVNKIHRIYERFERCTLANTELYKGSGLGLSITKQFLDELDGEIEVTSQEGKGTICTCIIPCSLSIMDLTNYDDIYAKFSSDRVSHKSTEQQIFPTVNTDISFDKLKVLLVEDDLTSRMIGRNILENIFHTNCSFAATGKEALDLFAHNKYDIIFMDIGLPDMTGIDVTLEIRTIDKKTPIIALSAHDKVEIKNQSLKAGMNDFLVKPFDLDNSRFMLQKWALHDIKSAIELPVQGVPAAVAKIEGNQILDFELCVKVANNDAKAAEQLWQVFAKQLPKYLEDLNASFDKQDIKMLHALSHKLKGATTYAVAPRLQVAAANLSDATRAKQVEIKDIHELYAKVIAGIQEVLLMYKNLGYI